MSQHNPEAKQDQGESRLSEALWKAELRISELETELFFLRAQANWCAAHHGDDPAALKPPSPAEAT